MGQDADLAALSTQLPLPSITTSGRDTDPEETLAPHESTITQRTSRRESIPVSFTSDTTGRSSSVYESAQSSNYSGSQATITRSETGLDSLNFVEARENVGESNAGSEAGHGGHQEVAHQEELGGTHAGSGVTPRPTQQGFPLPEKEEVLLEKSQEPPLVLGTSTSVDAASPLGGRGVSAEKSFISEKDGSEGEKEAEVSPLKKNKKKEKEARSGNNTPAEVVDLEDPELSHLTDEQRRVILEQMYVPNLAFMNQFFRLIYI